MDGELEKVTSSYTKAIDQLTSSVEKVGDQVSETQIELVKLSGRMCHMDEKIDTLTTAKEKDKSDSKDYVLTQFKLHEAQLHADDSGSNVKITLPWKIASGGLGIGGIGTLIYFLLQRFGN